MDSRPSTLADFRVPSPTVPRQEGQMPGDRSVMGPSSASRTSSGPLTGQSEPTAVKDKAGGIFGWGGVFDLGSTFASFRQPSPPDAQPAIFIQKQPSPPDEQQEIIIQKQEGERDGQTSLADSDALGGTRRGIGAEETPPSTDASGGNSTTSKPVPSNVWVPRPEDN